MNKSNNAYNKRENENFVKRKIVVFFLMSQGSLNPKIRFLGQKVWPVARAQTDTHTDRVTTKGTISGFHDFFFQPIIKDRPKTWR